MAKAAKSGRSNAQANAAAWSAMGIAERETGMTGEELTEQQRRLRAEFYERDAARRS